LSYKKERMGVA